MLDSKVVPVLSTQQLRALLAACQGPALRDRRDEALARLLTETGLRAGETVALRVEDVDLRAGTLHVRRGKGGKGRLVPFGPQTARALDRYRRLRRQHRLADTPTLWLGDQGRGFGYDADRGWPRRRPHQRGWPGRLGPGHLLGRRPLPGQRP